MCWYMGYVRSSCAIVLLLLFVSICNSTLATVTKGVCEPPPPIFLLISTRENLCTSKFVSDMNVAKLPIYPPPSAEDQASLPKDRLLASPSKLLATALVLQPCSLNLGFPPCSPASRFLLIKVGWEMVYRIFLIPFFSFAAVFGGSCKLFYFAAAYIHLVHPFSILYVRAHSGPSSRPHARSQAHHS